MLERWGEWAKERFSKEQKELTPKTEHIKEQELGGLTSMRLKTSEQSEKVTNSQKNNER